MNAPDVVALTERLIEFDSTSSRSNARISDYLADLLTQLGFHLERLSYVDGGEEKVSLIAQKGEGAGGLGFFSHSDTVPAGDGWNALQPTQQDGKLYGRGSCDMKGPLAATIVAAARVPAERLASPVYLAVTADEEAGFGGARQLIEESTVLAKGWPQHVVVAEPTRLTPVYAHKGGGRVVVTAVGRAAHTSTDQGVSANFLIAPFLAEMAELAERFRADTTFQNSLFDPPTNGFNMVLNDGDCKPNVTAARTICTLSIRGMPNAHFEEAISLVVDRARAHGLDVQTRMAKPFMGSPDTRVVRAALDASGADHPVTVPYGSEAILYQDYADTVVMGPGDISQAHTAGEWIELEQLHRGVAVFERMITQLCGAGAPRDASNGHA